jgi:hypothetical protein
MAGFFLHYDLADGYIHSWLVAGPLVVPLAAPAAAASQAPLSDDRPEPALATPPAERATFAVSGPEGAAEELTWNYRRVEEDHLLDLAGSHPPRHALQAWAFAELVSPSARSVGLILNAFGPAKLWLNGRLMLQQDDFSARLPHAVEGEAHLVAGANALLVRFEQRTGQVSPYAIALRVSDAEAGSLSVRLPTLNQKTQKHQSTERWARLAYTERDLYAADQQLLVKWPGGVRSKRPLMVRVERPSGYIIGHVERPLAPNASFKLLEATAAMDGQHVVRVCADYDEYVAGMTFSRDLDVNLLHSAHVEAPQGSHGERAKELLEHAMWWTEGLWAEVARMALGRWHELQQGVIREAIKAVSAQDEGYRELLLGLLLIAHRYAPHDSFPQALRGPLEECILGFDYDCGEGSARGDEGLGGDLAILGHAGDVLAGQLYPKRRLAHSGKTGRWHQKRGEEAALTWLARRAHGGFAAWGSDRAFGGMFLALVALVDDASSEALGELAAAIADKLLFTLAANSFKGVFGAASGSAVAASVTDGRMQVTSPLSRLLWGMGSWNQHMAAGVALAASTQYEAPEVLASIAADRPEEFWAREGHVVSWSGEGRTATPEKIVNLATYKSPDAMLSSAQDYNPGEWGRDEHIWQATLGPDALVFSNHPGCVSQRSAYKPNFWRGNGVLPRVVQWKDLLIALYRLPDDDWLGYTHAHFPVAAFDEHVLRQGWAFARKGEGYLALWASQGFALVKAGNSAYRELRSNGRHSVWLCQVGRAAQDGAFADFQRKVLAMQITVDELQVSCISLRGEAVALGWTGPLTVNGAAQPLTGYKHYENPYCVCDYGEAEMEIRTADWRFLLNLAP